MPEHLSQPFNLVAFLSRTFTRDPLVQEPSTPVRYVGSFTRVFGATFEHLCTAAWAQVLEDSIKDHVFLELGCGRKRTMGTELEEAQITPSHVIEVDIDLGISEGSARELMLGSGQGGGKVLYKEREARTRIQGDNLLVLQASHDGSANVWINGGSGIYSPEKAAAIAREAARVCPPGGIIGGVASDDIFQHLLPPRIPEDECEFDILFVGKKDNDSLMVLRKREE